MIATRYVYLIEQHDVAWATAIGAVGWCAGKFIEKRMK